METKVIKTREEYEAALAKVESLIDRNPIAGSREGDELELWALLVEQYESKEFPIGLPDPIEAIKFRMEEQGLEPRDLIPYIGSRSKVSEVLSRKRPLTLSMMRALHKGLGIPANVLLQENNTFDLNAEIEWDRFPLREMYKRGYFEAKSSDLRTRGEEILRTFFSPIGPDVAMAIHPKQGKHVRAARMNDKYALIAWTARVIFKARQDAPSVKYKPGTLNLEVMTQVARLSRSEEGPLLACEFLRRLGIALVVEPHLERTYLDGAAIMIEPTEPIIGLTLRYDRIDNFWFTLEHELAHVARHINGETREFFDDLDVDDQGNDAEKEADETAGEALIPQKVWERSNVSQLRSPQAVQLLADELAIHPAIVAGRYQHEYKSFRVLKDMVGQELVRQHFRDVKWDV